MNGLTKIELNAINTLKKRHPKKHPEEAFEIIFLVEFGGAMILMPKIGLGCTFDKVTSYAEAFKAFGEKIDRAIADPDAFARERELED